MTPQGHFWTGGFSRAPDKIFRLHLLSSAPFTIKHSSTEASWWCFSALIMTPPSPPQTSNISCTEKPLSVCIILVGKLSICCYSLKSPYVASNYLCTHPGGSESRMIKVGVETLCSVIRVVLIICKAQSPPGLMNITNCGCSFSSYAVTFCFGR